MTRTSVSISVLRTCGGMSPSTETGYGTNKWVSIFNFTKSEGRSTHLFRHELKVGNDLLYTAVFLQPALYISSSIVFMGCEDFQIEPIDIFDKKGREKHLLGVLPHHSGLCQLL